MATFSVSSQTDGAERGDHPDHPLSPQGVQPIFPPTQNVSQSCSEKFSFLPTQVMCAHTFTQLRTQWEKILPAS